MFKGLKEFLKNTGTPIGTMLAMERAYFEYRHQVPGREENVYLRLALQSRYPDKREEVVRISSECHDLEDAMLMAMVWDFGHEVAIHEQMKSRSTYPPCSQCNKYRALKSSDTLCYGCRTYSRFAACTKCRVYWDDKPSTCRECGGPVWKITDGPGVQMPNS